MPEPRFFSSASVPLNLTKTHRDSSPAIQVPSSTAQRFTLPNGLTIIVQEDRSAPVASLQAWCMTGSIHEDAQLGAGMSHLLEHMLFKGTTKRGGNEIAQTVQNAGGYINAYTSFDRTVYWIDIPAKGAAIALDILADAVMNSTLPEGEFEKEQEVIRREFAMCYDDPDRVSSMNLFEQAFSVHPYRVPIIGYMDVFNALTRDDVMTYYKARYVPNNMFFVVVGDVDAKAIREQLTTFFADHPRQKLAPTYLPPEPRQLGRRELHEEFATELTRLHLGWHIPSVTHPDVPALDILAAVLGDGRSSRLYRALREKAALVHSISAYCYTPREGGLFGIDATLDPEHRALVESAALGIVDEIRVSGISPAELEKTKKQFLSGHLQHLVTMRGKASDLGSNWLATRNLDFSRQQMEALQRVTSADLQRVAAAYLHDENLTVVSLNPTDSLSKEDAIHAVVQAGPVQRFVLSNGLRLLVREDPRLPLVSMVAAFKAGLIAETPENNGITALCSRTITRGTLKRDAAQIADDIEAVGGNIHGDSGNNSISVSVKVMQPDLRLGLGLLAEVLREPAFSENVVDREKAAQLANLKAEEEEITVVARHLLRETLYAGHPYGLRTHGTAGSVNRLDAAQLRAFHQEFICAENGVLAIFGNVNAEEVLPLAEQEFGALPAGTSALQNLPQPPFLQASRAVELAKDKAQAVLMVGYRGLDIFDPDRATIELIDEACSDLASRFFIRIREEMGLAYYVGTSQLAGLVPGPFVFYLGTAPERVAEVRTALLEEIAHLAEHGLTPEELARAQEKYLGGEDIRNQSEDAFAFVSALDELYGLGFQHGEEMKALIKAVTVADTQRVAQKLFRDAPSVIALVRP